MGFEYKNLGEECESRKESQREEIRMGWGQQFSVSQFLCMRGRGELEVDASMEGIL
jgi:hypothetical protein